MPGFVREDLKLLTVSECRTCVLYFAGSRENEVDQVDKDYKVYKVNWAEVQSGASSPAKHRGAYFSAVYGSIEDPVAAPGHCKPQVP